MCNNLFDLSLVLINIPENFTLDNYSFQELKYIEENNKLPLHHDKNKNIKSMAYWISNQKKNYIKKEKIMKLFVILSIPPPLSFHFLDYDYFYV